MPFCMQATKHLAEMARDMPNLKAFVHVSTAYVNGNQPKGSQVPEVMVPLLDHANSPVHHASLVSNLQTLPQSAAASQVCLLLITAFVTVALIAMISKESCPALLSLESAAARQVCMVLITAFFVFGLM